MSAERVYVVHVKSMFAFVVQQHASVLANRVFTSFFDRAGASFHSPRGSEYPSW